MPYSSLDSNAPPHATAVIGDDLVEVLCSLSLATDLASGYSPESSLKACLIALLIAGEIGASGDTHEACFLGTLLAQVGCTAPTHEQSLTLGVDDIGARQFLRESGNIVSTRGYVRSAIRTCAVDEPPTGRDRDCHEIARATCEVGTRLAFLLGMKKSVRRVLIERYERYDGRGYYHGLAEESISLQSRIIHVALTAESHGRTGGLEAIRCELAKRSGRHFDPRIAAAAARLCPHISALVHKDSVWDDILAAKPPFVCSTSLESVADAFAHFADMRCVYKLGHSRAVGGLAKRAGLHAGLGDTVAATIGLSGKLHDIGCVGVANSVWLEPSRLSAAQKERVHLHPYYTRSILERARSLRPMARLARDHHERLDGSGYPYGATARALSFPARILAAADVYQSLRERRPYRDARTKQQSMEHLELESQSGRLDADAVRRVLQAAGHERLPRQAWPGGLTTREVEVLRLLAIGQSNKQIARELGISARTVQQHIANGYGKTGIETRAAAAFFAVQHDLLHLDGD